MKFYEFFESDGVAFYDYLIPCFQILDEKMEHLNLQTLGRLEGYLIRRVVENLEKFKLGELDYYDFGTDDGIYIDMFGENYKDPEYRGRTIYSKAFSDYKEDLNFDDIYNLMKDYLEVIDEWEKRTGMEKPGW